MEKYIPSVSAAPGTRYRIAARDAPFDCRAAI